MDNVFFAVAAIAMIVAGLMCLVAGIVTFAAAAIRWEVLPRLKPVVVRAASAGKEWVAPDPVLKARRL